MQKFASVAALIPLVAGHGYISSPTPRSVGDTYKATCGEQPYYQESSDINGNIQGILQVVGDDYDASTCNLWLCKGMSLEDSDSSAVQSYTAGETVDFEVNIVAPHTGYANVSVVKTSTNSIIGSPLIEWDSYASNSGVAANNTAFSVDIPSDLGTECSTAGDCVLQWYWNAESIDQTYEGCVDFTVGGSSSGSSGSSSSTPAASSAASVAATSSAAAVAETPAAATSAAATSAAATTPLAIVSQSVAVSSAVAETPAATTSSAAAAATTPSDSTGDDDEDCDEDGDDTTDDGDDDEDCDDDSDDTTDDGDDEDCDDDEETSAVASQAAVTQAAAEVTTTVEINAQATETETVVAAESSAASSGSDSSSSGSSDSGSSSNNSGSSQGSVTHVTSYVTVTAKPTTHYVTVTAGAPACT